MLIKNTNFSGKIICTCEDDSISLAYIVNMMERSFGTIIKDARIDKSITLSDLAKSIAVDITTLSKVESGKRNFDPKKLPELCKELDLDLQHMEIELKGDRIMKTLFEDEEVMSLVKERLEEYQSNKKKKVNKSSRLVPELELFDEVLDWRLREFSNPNSTVRIGTLFSGIGAIEYAFHRLGLKHEIVFAGDIDQHVKQSYYANYEIAESAWHNDVTTFKADKYKGKIDLLVGGSPCQAFSMVGKRLGLEDIRGTLFYDYARIVQETQPKVFIYENVKGLTNHDGGRTWEVVKNVFNDLGYKIHSKILNSRDFGIPQNRERIFVIGFKDHDVDFTFPRPIQLERTMQDFLEDYTDSKYYLKQKGVKFVTSTKNRDKRYTQINGEVMLCQKANQQFNWHGDFVYEPATLDSAVLGGDFDEFVFDVNQVEEKYYLSDKVRDYVLAGGTKNFKTSTKTDLEVARPLLQSMHKMHRAGVDNYVTHNKGRIRKLTPKECLRLMGFTDDFKRVVSDTQLYRQAGNSIVVDVMIALLKQMDITKYGK